MPCDKVANGSPKHHTFDAQAALEKSGWKQLGSHYHRATHRLRQGRARPHSLCLDIAFLVGWKMVHTPCEPPVQVIPSSCLSLTCLKPPLAGRAACVSPVQVCVSTEPDCLSDGRDDECVRCNVRAGVQYCDSDPYDGDACTSEGEDSGTCEAGKCVVGAARLHTKSAPCWPSCPLPAVAFCPSPHSLRAPSLPKSHHG